MMLCLLGVLVFVIGAPFLVCKNKNDTMRKIFLCGVLFFVGGIINVHRIDRDILLLASTYEKPIEFSGRVIEIQEKEVVSFYVVKTNQIYFDGKENQISSKIRIKIKDRQNEITVGDFIKAKGIGTAFNQATNYGQYDEKTYMYGNGIFLAVEDISVEMIRRPKISIISLLYNTKKSMRDVYYDNLSEKDGSLASAMVLGEKKELDLDVKKMYQKNGIAHLIAISGLHIAMIAGALYQLLRKLVGGYVIPVSVGIGFIILYGLLTGLSSATCRAAIMLSVSLLSQLLGRKYDILSAVSFSLIVMLIVNPYQIGQAGFLLSYGAILGIAVVNPIWKIIIPQMPMWLEGLFVSLSVQISLTPIMFYYFYEIPIFGVVLNIIVVPLMSILLFFLIISGIIGLWFPQLSMILSFPVKMIFRIYEGLCFVNEHIPFHTFCMGKPNVWWVVFYYLLLIMVLIVVYLFADYKEWIYKYKILIICIMLLGLGFLLSPLFIRSQLLVSMFDVGQGDCIYIRTPSRYHILVDGGSSSKKNVGTYIMGNGLKYYGCDVLDFVVVTHSDSDHYSGIKELLEEDSIKIKNFIVPGIENPDDSYLELVKLARSRKCNIVYMCKGEKMSLDGLTFQCLNPQKKYYEDKNTGSLVFLLQYQKFDMLLTGDMDETVENTLLKQNKNWLANEIGGTLDIIKVSHHGSNTASQKSFIEFLKPDIALISVGENNSFGHPHKETMETLEKAGCAVYETKKSGQIMITINNKITVHQYR
ncbi:MAG: DNA internalization-related competence protein ComEC/Rec2 [Lachnospiraceae bacterium]